MKKSIQIQIPEPCHENWDKMTAANQGRFCNACSKVVVDFSMMSDKEILNHISTAGSKICGRVNNDQLNRPIQMPVERKQISFKYLWSLLISSFLLGYKTQAQGKIKVDSIPSTAPALFTERELIGTVGAVIMVDKNRVKNRISLIKGKVTTENGAAVPFATIKIANSKYGTITDSSGEFQLKVNPSLLSSTLMVSSVGYEAVSVDLKNEDPEYLHVLLANAKNDLLGEVIVRAYQPNTCSVRMGGLSYGISISENRIKTLFDDLIGRNEIRLFPNPVSCGTAFNLSFNVAETGNYKLELYDASGRMLHASTIPIPSKKYVMNFGNGLPLTAGIYFVKILSAKGRKVYSGNLLVQ